MKRKTSHRKTSTDNELFPEHDVHIHNDDSWAHDHDEGQLAVDVCETPKEIILHSAIAGVKPEDLEVFVQDDMFTVRGHRSHEYTESHGNYLVRECHWGRFSRSIILPSKIDSEKISATLKDGILTVRMPKIDQSHKIEVKKL